MMVVIVTVLMSFSLTASETKTGVMCLNPNGVLDTRRQIQRRGSRPGVQTNARFRIPWGLSSTTTPTSIEVDRCIRDASCGFRKYTFELYDQPSAPLELKIRMLEAEVLETLIYGCVM